MNKISWSFRGTFSANNIPKFKDKFFSLIVNLSNEGETGTHFIAIFITENKILYFNSLGSFQINPNIKHYLETYKKPISYDQKQIQHLLSSHCGFFCISCILCLENNIPFHKFLKIFHKKDLYLNDYISIKIITSFIKYMYLRK